MWITNQAKNFLLLGVVCGLTPGCEEDRLPAPTNNPPPVVTPDLPATPGEQKPPLDPANTGVNERDMDESKKTPLDQNENKVDIDITAEIRKQVVDTKMSVDAQNVKIITQDGKVTLRGPVASEDEKKQIAEMAEKVAGPGNVDNQLEVTTP